MGLLTWVANGDHFEDIVVLLSACLILDILVPELVDLIHMVWVVIIDSS